jgi:hypothetical protein
MLEGEHEDYYMFHIRKESMYVRLDCDAHNVITGARLYKTVSRKRAASGPPSSGEGSSKRSR